MLHRERGKTNSYAWFRHFPLLVYFSAFCHFVKRWKHFYMTAWVVHDLVVTEAVDLDFAYSFGSRGNDRIKSSQGGYLMNWLSRLALFLVIIGALNWLLVGLFEWDLVSAVFGGETMRASSMLSRIVYSLVGLSGLYCLTFLFADTIVGTEQR